MAWGLEESFIRINMKVDEDNDKSLGMVNLRYQKMCQFSSSGFWKNIGCLVSAHTFAIGGSRLQEKEDKIKKSGKRGRGFKFG